MNLSIPDRLYKFIVLTGAIIVGFMYFEEQKNEKVYFDKIDVQHNMLDSLSIELRKSKYETNEMFKYSNTLSKRYNVQSPLKYNKDSSLIFTRTFIGNKNEIMVSDSIDKLWNKSLLNDKKFEILLEKIKITSKRLNDEEKLKNDRQENLNYYSNIGFLMLGLGMCMWLLSELPEIKDAEVEHYSKKLEDRHYIHCQSCGKKFTSMKKYGIESDGISKNYAFCESCYELGNFKDNGLSVESLIEEAKEKNSKLPKFMQNILIKRIKKLERWNV